MLKDQLKNIKEKITNILLITSPIDLIILIASLFSAAQFQNPVM